MLPLSDRDADGFTLWENAVRDSIGPCEPADETYPTQCEAHDSTMMLPEMCLRAAEVFRAAEAAVGTVLQQVLRLLESETRGE